MPTLLEIRNAHAGYGEIRILHDIGLSIAQGSVVAVIGSNGAGKTTLMRALSGLLRADGGHIFFQDQDVTALPAHRRVALGISLVPEGRLVFPDLTVDETLRIGASIKRARSGWQSRRDDMYAMFPRLRERRTSQAGSLSGGEQQMLAIARALMSMPSLLLLDEPSLGLSPIMAEEVFDRIGAIRAMGTTICLVEQNVYSALAIADTAYVLEDGRVVMQGPADQLLETESIRKSFLGL